MDEAGVPMPFLDLRVNLEELEFLWMMCYCVQQKQVIVHEEYYRIACQFEPILYRTIQGMVPGWQSPVKQQHN